MNWIPWAILGAAAVGGTIYVASKASAAPATGSSSAAPPGVNTGPWKDATTINPGDHVRITMDPLTFGTVLSSMPQLGTGKTAWTALLAQVHQTLTANSQNAIQAWGPGDALPTDWPVDDAHKADGYHAQFDYIGTVPLPVNTLPIIVQVWTMPGGLKATFPIVPVNLSPGVQVPTGTSTGGTTTTTTGQQTNVVVNLQPGAMTVTIPAGQGMTLQAPGTATIQSLQHGPSTHSLAINAPSYTFAPGTFAAGTTTLPQLSTVTWGYAGVAPLTTQLSVIKG